MVVGDTLRVGGGTSMVDGCTLTVGINIAPRPSRLGDTITSVTQQPHCAMANVASAMPSPV
jgi:hypothetical protein